MSVIERGEDALRALGFRQFACAIYTTAHKSSKLWHTTRERRARSLAWVSAHLAPAESRRLPLQVNSTYI